MSLFSSLLKGVGYLSSSAIKTPGKAIFDKASSLWSGVRKADYKGLADNADDLWSSFASSYKTASKSGAVFSGLGRGSAWFGKGSAHVIGSVMKFTNMKYASMGLVVTAGAVGLAYGAGRTAIQRSNERTMANSQRGLPANNLGTDGLTLALSKRRHR